MKRHIPFLDQPAFFFYHPLITPTSNSFPEETPYLGVILQLWHLKAAFFFYPTCFGGALPLVRLGACLCLMCGWEEWGALGSPPCPRLCVLLVFGSVVGGLSRVSIELAWRLNSAPICLLASPWESWLISKSRNTQEGFLRPMGQMEGAAEVGYLSSTIFGLLFSCTSAPSRHLLQASEEGHY